MSSYFRHRHFINVTSLNSQLCQARPIIPLAEVKQFAQADGFFLQSCSTLCDQRAGPRGTFSLIPSRPEACWVMPTGSGRGLEAGQEKGGIWMVFPPPLSAGARLAEVPSPLRFPGPLAPCLSTLQVGMVFSCCYGFTSPIGLAVLPPPKTIPCTQFARKILFFWLDPG